MGALARSIQSWTLPPPNLWSLYFFRPRGGKDIRKSQQRRCRARRNPTRPSKEIKQRAKLHAVKIRNVKASNILRAQRNVCFYPMMARRRLPKTKLLQQKQAARQLRQQRKMPERRRRRRLTRPRRSPKLMQKLRKHKLRR